MDNRPLLSVGMALAFAFTIVALSGCATVPQESRKAQRSISFDTRAGMVSVPMGWR